MISARKFYTVKEVAEILRLNILTVYEYLKKGNLIAVRFGRSYRVEEKDLDRFIEEHLSKKGIEI